MPSQTESSPSVAILLTKDAEDFPLPDDVLTDDSSACPCPMLWLLLRVQLSTAWLFLRGLAVTVQLLDPLITLVRSTLSLCRHGDLASLAQVARVRPALADSDPADRAGRLHNDELGFLRVALFLAAVVTPLFFCGRSPGLAATSTTSTSNGVALFCNFFFPAKGNSLRLMSRVSIRCTVRHPTDSATPHESPLWQ